MDDIRRQKPMNTIPTSLPLDLLLHKLVCFIPFPEVLKLRCVCKTWRQMLPELLKMNHGLMESDTRPWLVMSCYPAGQRCGIIPLELVAYVSSLKRWLPFCLGSSYTSQALTNPIFNSTYLVDCKPTYMRKLVLCSSGGLICTVVSDGNLLLFNPLTGKARKLIVPNRIEPQDYSSESIFMVQGPQPGSYYVLVVTVENGDESRVQIYDVKAQIWKPEIKCEGRVSRSGVLGFVPFSRMKYCADQDIKDSDIFCYRFSEEYNEPEAWRLSGYCISRDSWAIVDVATPDIEDMEPSQDLAVWKEHSSGRIFLACIFRPDPPARLENDRGCYIIAPIPAGFGVWELYEIAEQGYYWHQISTSPISLLRNFHSDPLLNAKQYIYSQVSFFTSDNIVCMSVHRYIDYPERVRFAPPILYDIAKDEWSELPAVHGECHREIAMFAYSPSFDDSIF